MTKESDLINLWYIQFNWFYNVLLISLSDWPLWKIVCKLDEKSENSQGQQKMSNSYETFSYTFGMAMVLR